MACWVTGAQKPAKLFVGIMKHLVYHLQDEQTGPCTNSGMHLELPHTAFLNGMSPPQPSLPFYSHLLDHKRTERGELAEVGEAPGRENGKAKHASNCSAGHTVGPRRASSCHPLSLTLKNNPQGPQSRTISSHLASPSKPWNPEKKKKQLAAQG